MNAEIPETWTTRELPVLASVLRRFDAGELLVDLEDVRAELQMSGPQMMAAVTALRDATPPYIELELTGGWAEWHAGAWFRACTSGLAVSSAHGRAQKACSIN